uniref:ATP-dependent DNA helicase n=1 Tax=Tanacetum cinerariifolium TaxID=118510 RepID=A0A699HCV2_TANCI|nr:DNA helicase [Tanacetum cinerariifolium]
MLHYVKLLRHLWNAHKEMSSLLKKISPVRDDVMIKTLLLLHQILIQKTTDTREAPSSFSQQQSSPHAEQPIEDIHMPDTTNISDSEDTYSTHLPKIKPRPEWLKPIPEEDRPETLEPDWIGKKKLSKSDLKGPTYKDQVDLVNPEGHQLVLDVTKPLPLGGPPGQHSQISHADSQGCQSQDYERHGYPFLREIVLRRADYKEYNISEAEKICIQMILKICTCFIFKTKLNLTQPDWDASDFLFKEDYTIVSKPRGVIYRYRNDQKKMMRETEVHKFSDGTLQRIRDKLDHMVKDFKLRCFKTLDRSLRDLMNASYMIFKGKTVVLGGDFSQTLPVKKGDEKQELITASITKSYLWWHFTVCFLTVNMRLLRLGLDQEQQRRSKISARWMLDVRNGEIGDPDEEDNEDNRWIIVPKEYCTPSNAVDAVNAKILSLIEGPSRTYLSKDEALPIGRETSETEMLLSGTMSENTIASLKVGQENCILEARVYRKWISKSIQGTKEIAFR